MLATGEMNIPFPGAVYLTIRQLGQRTGNGDHGLYPCPSYELICGTRLAAICRQNAELG